MSPVSWLAANNYVDIINDINRTEGMTDFLIRDIDEDVMRRLKERARRNGRSLQQEVHEALAKAAKPASEEISRMFEEFDAKHGRIKLDPEEIVEIITQEREDR